MAGERVGYFGFGSLVNRHTLRTEFIGSVPATLHGWHRHWQARTQLIEPDVALLSIHQEPASAIHGMLVIDRLENLPQVDAREEGYSRFALSPDDLELPHDLVVPDALYVYVANEDLAVADTGALLQSYLDAVMQGFHQEYGDDGVRHFVETTKGFDRPLIRDRENPLYPRSVILSADQRRLFDELLEGIVAA